MKKYLVKIEDSIMPQSYTFDQLIDTGLLDNVDDKIKVKLEGDSVWITARDYPFSDVENSVGNEVGTMQIEQRPSTQRVTHSVLLSNTTITSHTTPQPRVRELRRRIPIESTQQRTINPMPTTPSILNTWNWGAFSLSWIWGVCNGIYWPLIMIACNFIPYIGVLCSLGICIYLGLKGNEMAWVNARQKGTDVYSFESTQGTWNKVGLVLFFVCFLIGALSVIIFLL